MEDERSDAELLERISKADDSSFCILLQRYSRSCYRVAYRVLYDKSMSEDVVQDVMIKLWTKPHLWDEKKAKGKVKFSSWLYRVVINEAIDVYRRNKKTMAVEDWDMIESTELNQREGQRMQNREVEMSKIMKLLNDKIGDLPLNQNVALVLCRMEGMSHKDAAEVMAITPKAVERCIDRGIKKLRSSFAQENLDIGEILAID